MDDTISVRGKAILRALAQHEQLSREQLQELTGESRNNLLREIKKLHENDWADVTGEARATRYSITPRGRALSVWDAEAYAARGLTERQPRFLCFAAENLKYFAGTMQFSAVPVVIRNVAFDREARGMDISTRRKELERFVIELSWKSSKIEGNTYTLLETERLIRESELAPGHLPNEAQMILNHKRAFDYVWQHRKTYTAVTWRQIEEIHTLLTEGLDVPTGVRQGPVGITGTAYVPPRSRVEIISDAQAVIDTVNKLDDPLEKALASVMLLSYLQPFVDGNKRTSRLVANAVLMAHGYSPMSYRSVDENEYKAALILFYEQGAIANFRDIFLEQLRESALAYFFPVGD